MRIVLYGFEPFGGDAINPSQLVARALDGAHIAGNVVIAHVLPVETRSLRARLESLLNAERPSIVVGLGLAAGNASLAVERVAINALDSRIPDNQGFQAKGPIREDGAAAIFATLPTAEIVDRWRASAIPGYVSNSAGTFCCNHALYESLSWAQEQAGEAILTGFIHLPYLPGQAAERDPSKTPSMALETMKRGVELAIETAVAALQRRAEEASKPPEDHKRTKGELWIPRGR